MNVRAPLILAALLFGSTTVLADQIVVIVNPENPAKLSKEAVAAYYVGDSKSWIGGLPVKMYDLPAGNAERAEFDKSIVGKSEKALKDVWAQNTLSGKSIAPKEVGSDDEVKKAVSSSKLAIGYIKASSVDSSVKVAFTP
jgi:ABC-type phosphate transport system substrate-binding protein